MTATLSTLVDAAGDYIDRGWPIVPCDGKVPIGKAWQDRTHTVETIEAALSKAAAPAVGVKLGPAGGIVDIEADSPEEEAAFAELFAGCEAPATPTFASSRGKHRLFKWSATLANTAKAVVYFRGSNGAKLGIRIGADGKGAQSVIPPSPGRKWLVSPDDDDLAELPAIVIERIVAAASGGTLGNGKAKRTAEHWEQVLGGIDEGAGRNESLASFVGYLLRGKDLDNADDVRIARETAWAVNQQNRPPLGRVEFDTTFESILKRERSKEQLGEQYAVWSMVEIGSEPKCYALVAPEFSKARDGEVLLVGDAIESGRRVRSAIREQAGIAKPVSFIREYDNKLYVPLFEGRTFRDAPPEQKRQAVLAGRILAALLPFTKREKLESSEFKTVEEYNKYQSRRAFDFPALLADGSLIFRFDFVIDALEKCADKPNRLEVSRLLGRAGAIEYRPAEGDGCRPRLRRLPASPLDKLVRLANGEEV